MTVVLQTIGVIVKNAARSLEFYRMLGLSVPPGEPEAPNLDVLLPNGLTLGFLTDAAAAEGDPAYRSGVSPSLNLQFMFHTAAEVDAAHARLVAAGHVSHAAPWDAPWGQRFARVIDPDGRIVNLYAHQRAA